MTMDNFQEAVHVTEITHQNLRALLEGCTERVLLIDTRPFLAFNDCHVVMADNTHFPAIIKRRSKGSVGLDLIIKDGDKRGKLLAGFYSDVVVYDESSDGQQHLTRDSTTQLVLNGLRQNCSNCRVAFLKGGFDKFSAEYPDLCQWSSPPVSPFGFSSPTSSATLTAHSTSAFSTATPGSEPVYDRGQPVEILPYLYLGSGYHASRKDMLEALGITALLNVSRTCPNHFESEYMYKCIPVEDTQNADIQAWFQEAIDYIDLVKLSGGRVLVHCHAGVSRSATICLAYLMHTNRVRLDEAFDFVKQRRSVISPNFNFMGQLLQWEAQLHSAAPPSGNAKNCSSHGEVRPFCSSPSTSISSPAPRKRIRSASCAPLARSPCFVFPMPRQDQPLMSPS
ncbi:dual specificity protein phosphatase 1-like [Branchiostoma floridae]|uniref:Dual specificity protein phosphatase n=1 Tax=Branchiostoma floridae TaxID=7739 RepID=A0A9J7KYM6_BRAFL|nr:dual specificity protein phosphatase 1-like [Branchiostoma floridae]